MYPRSIYRTINPKGSTVAQKILDTDFTYTMLKGRSLPLHRLHRAMRNAKFLLRRLSKLSWRELMVGTKNKDGTLSDFQKSRTQQSGLKFVRNGLCSPKLCGNKSDFAQDHPICFQKRAIVFYLGYLVLNHTLFHSFGFGSNMPAEGVLIVMIS